MQVLGIEPTFSGRATSSLKQCHLLSPISTSFLSSVCWFVFWFFETGFLCVAFGACPGTHSVDQADLELRDLPASVPGFYLISHLICVVRY